MEKRNNKKLFAIIGGSVLAFVLTIALSVSITLAYFGATADGSQKVTMDKAITVGYTAVAKADLKDALPGQKVELKSTATIGGGSVNGAFLAAEVTITDTKGLMGTLKADTLKVAGWAYYDGYYYYVGGTATDAGTTSTVVKHLPDAGEATFATDFIIPTTLTDKGEASAAEAVLTIKVEYIAVQGVAFVDGSPVGQNETTIDNIATMVADVQANNKTA